MLASLPVWGTGAWTGRAGVVAPSESELSGSHRTQSGSPPTPMELSRFGAVGVDNMACVCGVLQVKHHPGFVSSRTCHFTNAHDCHLSHPPSSPISRYCCKSKSPPVLESLVQELQSREPSRSSLFSSSSDFPRRELPSRSFSRFFCLPLHCTFLSLRKTRCHGDHTLPSPRGASRGASR